MRPKAPTVEIPHRPVYRPGSGPPMAAVTLTPDNTETGWIIVDIVEFQGIPQYVVTPENNPAHRKPVRKERILDWVSPKAHEDFEYAQYKKQTDREWERDNKALKKAVKIKEKRFDQEQARRQARSQVSSKALATAMASKPQLRSELRRSGRGSVSGSGNESSETMTIRRLSTKRKYPQEHLNTSVSVVKRRAVSETNQGLTLQQKSPSLAREIHDPSMSGEDGDAIDEEDYKVIEVARRNLAARENQPLRLHQKDFQGSLTGFTSGKAATLRSMSTQASPKQIWSGLGPPIRVSVVLPKLPFPAVLSKATLVTNKTIRERDSNQTDYPAILAPAKHANARASSPKSNNISKKSLNMPTSLVDSVSMDKSQPFGESKESPVTSKGLRPSRRKVLDRSQSTVSQSTTRGLDPPRKATERRQKMAANGESVARTGETTRKEKKSHGSARKKPGKGKGREMLAPNSELLKQQTRELENQLQMAAAENAEEDEESWEINGIVDDEIRTENGQKMQYYLCSWVGDYQPTWEPEFNVSLDSVNAYKQNLVSDLGFDEFNDTNGIAGPSNSRGRDPVDTGENDSNRHHEDFTDTLALLRPSKDPEFDTIVADGVKGDYNLHLMQMRAANKRAESYL